MRAAPRRRRRCCKDLNERTVLETIRVGRADLARGDLAPRRHLQADRLDRAPVAARRRARARARSRTATARATARPSSSRWPRRPACWGSTSARASCAAASATCRGEVRARRDVELAGADPKRVFDAAAELTRAPRRRERPAGRARAVAVVGVPGVVEPPAGASRSPRTSTGSMAWRSGAELERELGLAVDVENDVNLAALGERWRGVARGVEPTSPSSRSAPASAPGWCCGASCIAATTARPARWTTRSARASSATSIPARRRCSTSCAPSAAERPARDRAERALRRCREVFAAARDGDSLARAVVAEEARRIALPHRADRRRCGHRPGRDRRRHRRERRPAARAGPRRAGARGCPTRRASRSRRSATPPS